MFKMRRVVVNTTPLIRMLYKVMRYFYNIKLL